MCTVHSASLVLKQLGENCFLQVLGNLSFAYQVFLITMNLEIAFQFVLGTRSETMWAVDSSVCVHIMTLVFRELSKQCVLRHTIFVSRGQNRGWDRRCVRIINKRELRGSICLQLSITVLVTTIQPFQNFKFFYLNLASYVECILRF